MARVSKISLNEAELAVLGPLAEHRILTLPQLALLLGEHEQAAGQRLEQLHQAGLVRLGQIFEGLPAAAAVSRTGLRALGSPLHQPPAVNLNQYRHEVGVGWLWLAARAGRFGELTALTAERRMHADDAAASAVGGHPPWGLGVGVFDPYGRPRRHYPDLMLDTASGHRVAVELELTAKSSVRMARLMRAYASDARVDHVLYLVANERIATLVAASAERAGIAARVQVQLLEPDGIAGAEIGTLGAAERTQAPAARAGAER